VRPADIKDGLAQTLFVVETDQADIPWSAPIDLDPRTGRLTNTSDTSVGPHASHSTGQMNVLLADGAVRRLTLDQLRKLLPAAATIAGGEPISWPE
jgi:prepilin-type processing-associated H-X9-DG protein